MISPCVWFSGPDPGHPDHGSQRKAPTGGGRVRSLVDLHEETPSESGVSSPGLRPTSRHCPLGAHRPCHLGRERQTVHAGSRLQGERSVPSVVSQASRVPRQPVRSGD